MVRAAWAGPELHLVVTGEHVLCVAPAATPLTPPQIQWSSRLDDIEDIWPKRSRLVLTGLQPSVVPQRLTRFHRVSLVRPAASPFWTAVWTCADEASARDLVAVLRVAKSRAAPRMLLSPHGLLVRAPPPYWI